ncbi:MAG: hypothetical protein NTY38_05495 [Acidobacteria bacterium]|nr:hypothetical protein [Acidobacteriota bacterium]
MPSKRTDLDLFLGRSPETLSLPERFALAGRWIALEIYSPKNLALRKVEAIGDSIAACTRQLQARGLAASKYEFQLLHQPY